MRIIPRPAVSLGICSLSTIGERRRFCHAPILAFGSRWRRVGFVVTSPSVFRARKFVPNRGLIYYLGEG